MIVDDNIHIIGIGQTEDSRSVINYQIYNSKLINQFDFSDTLDSDFVNRLNSKNEKDLFKFGYKRSEGRKSPNIPLLNFDFIYTEVQKNGNVIMVLEKNVH